mmetsp:Transcript_82588/g.191892  ORF Transcript_82588/g.191892 Transcript_82588/m.191892 type:complete len:91 (+) Transcript_82588:342-614(+)
MACWWIPSRRKQRSRACANWASPSLQQSVTWRASSSQTVAFRTVERRGDESDIASLTTGRHISTSIVLVDRAEATKLTALDVWAIILKDY